VQITGGPAVQGTVLRPLTWWNCGC